MQRGVLCLGPGPWKLTSLGLAVCVSRLRDPGAWAEGTRSCVVTTIWPGHCKSGKPLCILHSDSRRSPLLSGCMGCSRTWHTLALLPYRCESRWQGRNHCHDSGLTLACVCEVHMLAITPQAVALLPHCCLHVEPLCHIFRPTALLVDSEVPGTFNSLSSSAAAVTIAKLSFPPDGQFFSRLAGRCT